MDNQVRYAHNTITISLKTQPNSQILIQVGNDGPSIEEKTMKTLFEKFHPGMKGEFGLGLSITAESLNSMAVPYPLLIRKRALPSLF